MLINIYDLNWGEAKGPDPGIAQVKERLANVKHKVLILSGKGGVGKSTLSALLGRALAAKFPDKNVSYNPLFLKVDSASSFTLHGCRICDPWRLTNYTDCVEKYNYYE